MASTPATRGRTTTPLRRMQWTVKVAWLIVERIFDLVADAFEGYARIMRREFEFFLGLAFVLSGLLNVGSGKYCDGNTAEYLACTHPATYYYYNGFEIALVVIGAFLIALWVLKRSEKRA